MMWKPNTLTKSGATPMPLTDPCKCRELCPVLTGANKEEDWYETERCASWQTPLPMGNFSTWQLLFRAMLSSGWCHSYTKKSFLTFAHGFTTHRRNGWSRSSIFATDAGANLQTGVVSHVISEEANIRLSQLCWARIRTKCKEPNSNIMTTPSLYRGG